MWQGIQCKEIWGILLQEVNIAGDVFCHYSDVILGTIASQITSLTTVYSTVYSAQTKENIKAQRHWPLLGEFTGDRWIPLTKGQ